jgi:hypothetical protein
VHKTTARWLVIAASLPFVSSAGPAPAGTNTYTEEHVYLSRPNPGEETPLGDIGVTGLKARIYRGVEVKVEGVRPNTPAAGKFKPGQLLDGINGETLKGKNPFVVLGTALTKAEATDGKMSFTVRDAPDAPAKQVTVLIPVLGAYSTRWPNNCPKSKKIIKQAAEYYSTDVEFKKRHFAGRGLEGALACLFLLSTGEDKYLPCVKAYFAQFPKEVKGIGDHTWNNGYNGIACAEYYLRTGDKEVLPILQYYCDDAKARQKFGCSWTHWSDGISPGYVAGGLMNPAGCQVLTTLLLSKACGVEVDEKTLLGALTFWYRFTGHGTVPYGDHRPEGGLGSNGKDGMAAAAMLIASRAEGAVSLYKKARDYYAMSMLDSYPVLVMGHGDEGRGDAIWRGLASSYLLGQKPEAYHATMKRLTWWYDLSRRASGGLGIATIRSEGFDEEGGGAAVALSYTAPLKTLQITGAPRSKYAKAFKLPERPWGRKADEAFLSIENNPAFSRYGKPAPAHVPFWQLGSAYHKPEVDLKGLPRNEILKNAYHANYMIRVQAAKALREVGALDELEKLLRDPDPRIRRAGLDGIIDYNYWFGMGGARLTTEALTPGMIAAVKKMLADPEEAVWVVDGALLALSLAPAKEINSCLPLVMPWTTHQDWWLRESSFMALLGMEKEEALFQGVLPTLVNMMVTEYHTMPRDRFVSSLGGVLSRKKGNEVIAKRLVDGLMRGVNESEIIQGARVAEGAHNMIVTANACLSQAPEKTIEVAQAIKKRFSVLDGGQIVKLVGSPNSAPEGHPSGLYTARDKLQPAERQQLTDILFNDFRPELAKRLKVEKEESQSMVDTILDLAKLKNPEAGWHAIGTPAPAERCWRYLAFEPKPADALHMREKKRFRDVALPSGCETWSTPGFDDSTWKSGKAPIGVGLCQQGKISFTNQAEWGPGEFLLARCTFELEALDCDMYRLSVLARQGYHIYLNGQRVHTYIWWKDKPFYNPLELSPREAGYLVKGKNVLAVYCNVEYSGAEPLGQIDVIIEGLKKKDLE